MAALTAHRAVRRTCLAVGFAAVAALVAVRLHAHGAGEPFLQPAGPAPPLRVLTWNVGQIYLGTQRDSRAADSDLAHVAQVITSYLPDLVALQELRGNAQLQRLLSDLHGEYTGFVPDEEINDRRAATLVRVRPGVSFAQLVTSTGRALALARLPVGARRLTFVSVHLDAFDPKLRQAQAEELVDWAARASDREIIIAGDFNFDADFLAASEPEHPDVSAYRLLASHFQDAARGGRATTIVDRRLDYLFTRGKLTARRVDVLRGMVTRFMDHAPVLAEFELAPVL
jgi:endonuclease/exonuclease/phosphatase family metal-dependent hydrolase